jgi:hypothetical protein
LRRRKASSSSRSWSEQARLEAATKACPSHCPWTATPPSWADPAPTMLIAIGRLPADLLGRRGCSRAAVLSGGSKPSWLAPPANMEEACGRKVHRSPCPPTAIPSLWADLAIIEPRGRRGFSPAAVMPGRSKVTSWSAVERVNQHCLRVKGCLSPSLATATLPSWVGGEVRVRGYSPAAAVPGVSKARSS